MTMHFPRDSAKVHPPSLFPYYTSTVKRAPKRPLIILRRVTRPPNHVLHKGYHRKRPQWSAVTMHPGACRVSEALQRNRVNVSSSGIELYNSRTACHAPSRKAARMRSRAIRAPTTS